MLVLVKQVLLFVILLLILVYVLCILLVVVISLLVFIISRLSLSTIGLGGHRGRARVHRRQSTNNP